MKYLFQLSITTLFILGIKNHYFANTGVELTLQRLLTLILKIKYDNKSPLPAPKKIINDNCNYDYSMAWESTEFHFKITFPKLKLKSIGKSYLDFPNTAAKEIKELEDAYV